MGVLTDCKPRREVLKGDLDDAIFAADFGDLIADKPKAPKVYSDARTFFQNTHPAKQLRKIVESVFGRLANPKEPGALIRLSTGFGGGKTHTLMALWHLSHNVGDPSLGTELLPAAGRPKKVSVPAVDAGKAGVPEFSSHGSLTVRSLWGELFYRLGGAKALKALDKADDPESSPSELQIESVFPEGPVLVLLDEVVVYMAKLSERGEGNLLGFLKSLLSVVKKRRQTVLIVTDPAGQVAYAKQAAKLREIFGRETTEFDPIGDEAAGVIVCRLFESVNPTAAQAASAAYHALYQRVVQESPGTIPPFAASADYAKRIVECYPFHPRLLDTAQDRLGALQDFQKSRGVLRLFARIIRDIWGARGDLDLISAGEIIWSSPRIQADLLQRLNRDNFKAAVSADVEKHAGELDGDAPRGIHRRVASALLLESLPLQPNSGLDKAELTLAVLRPDEAGPEPGEALDRLYGSSWHIYPMPGGRGWQFRYEPNINKRIEEEAGLIPVEDAKSRVLVEAQEYFSGPAFKVSPWPTSARQVPKSAQLQLVLCENERTAKSVCVYEDDTDPKAPIPRAFVNSIVAVTARAEALNAAIDRAARLLAADVIERESKSGESARLVREQLKTIKPELHKKFRIQTCRAFDRVVLSGGEVLSLEERFQVSEDQILQRAHGQNCLRKFLDEKNLIYQPGDALDVNRFMKDILPGATPLADQPDVYTARAIHERFLGAPGLRLIPDGSIVRQTILRAVAEGKLVVRLSDGRTYDAKGCVEGPPGRRRRVPGELTTLSLDDTVLVTRPSAATAAQWTKEDAPPGKPGKEGAAVAPPVPLPPAPSRAVATSWDQVVEYATDRPLLQLILRAPTPSSANSLAALAQPLGADRLTLSVTVSGSVKDGGTMSFAAGEVRPTHPAKPLAIAQTVFNSLSDGATYETELTLDFGAAGRTGMQAALQQLAEGAPGDVRVEATFDKPLGGTSL